MEPVPGSPEDRLDSWKEIAAYLKRGVRTVRRWERQEGLPVHRHMHRVLGGVYAYKSEIDSWQQHSRHDSISPSATAGRLTTSASRRGRFPVRSIAVLPFINLSTEPESYLRARQQAWRWRKDAITPAIQLLHNRLAVVGASARLYAAVGHAYLQYREAGIDLSEPLDEAEACVRKVFALEPRSAAGLQLRGWVHYARGLIQDA
jgi:hypothetical protein